MTTRWSSWRREASILLAFVAASALLTWPWLAHFTTDIGGDYGDHWQTLWGMWWVHKAIVELHQSPFFSTYVHWPIGMPMVFQTFDLPDALMAVPLWGLLRPIALFNLFEFSGYPLAGYFFYRFALELLRLEGVANERPGQQRAAAALAGGLFTFTPYHFGHAVGHMHIIALQWIPLYFWMLLRTLYRPERRWPLLAAVALAATATASWYHLLFCVFLTAPYLTFVALTDPRVRSWATVRRAVLLGAAFLAILWPLLAAMIEAKLGEKWDGAHDPIRFSADLLEFFVPNAAQALGGRLPFQLPFGLDFVGVQRHWTGSFAEDTDYLGYGVLCLALLGAVRWRAARFWLGTAALGAVLALGPKLHVGGQIVSTADLPYGLLVKAVPLLEFMGVPVRAGLVANFALAAAAALGLAWLFSLRWGRTVAALALFTAVVELWPHPFTICHFPQPEIFERWAADPTPFAVMDLSGDTRPLYNGVLHGHPMVDVYLTRTPVRLLQWLDDDPILGRIRHPTREPLPMGREDGRALLRRLQIRYFVLPAWRRDATLERDLELPTIYVGEGLRIYEVPDWPRA